MMWRNAIAAYPSRIQEISRAYSLYCVDVLLKKKRTTINMTFSRREDSIPLVLLYDKNKLPSFLTPPRLFSLPTAPVSSGILTTASQRASASG